MQAVAPIAGVPTPRVMVGSSPFVGAGQFGFRAVLYAERFLGNPENMVKIYVKALRLGLNGFNVLGVDKVVYALAEASRRVRGKPFVLATCGMWGEARLWKEYEVVRELSPKLIALHANVVDREASPRGSMSKLASLVSKLKSLGHVVGIATHAPGTTIPIAEDLKLDVDFYFAPVNKLGEFMGPDPQVALRELKRASKPVIAKKCLAAGKLKLQEALDFIFKDFKAAAAVVGVASEEEVVQLANYADTLQQPSS